jgi:ParB family transcriptional regulator, chromosome partitioning protein
MTQSLVQIPVESLIPDPNQPRRHFLEAELKRLAASVTARGILQPLRVIRDEERKCWRIITGESRWRAAQMAHLATVPCIPVEGEVSETDILADQIVENSVRSDLLPLCLARAMSKLKKLKGCSSQDLATELGISGGTITKCEALLTLPEEIQALVDEGRVPESSAYEISRISDPKAQFELAHAVAAGRLKRDQVVDAVRSRIGKRNITPKAGRLSCKHAGISITVSSNEPLRRESLMIAIDHLKKQAQKLTDQPGKEVATPTQQTA